MLQFDDMKFWNFLEFLHAIFYDKENQEHKESHMTLAYGPTPLPPLQRNQMPSADSHYWCILPRAIKMALTVGKLLSMGNASQIFSLLLWAYKICTYQLASSDCNSKNTMRLSKRTFTAQEKEVPIKSRAITQHSCTYISLRLPCWWGYQPETRR